MTPFFSLASISAKRAVNLKLCVVIATAFVLLFLLAQPTCAQAESRSYLIMGADVTKAQQEKVIADFALNKKELKSARRIAVSNKEEHKRCDKSIPKSVTGNKTLSCAYLKLTDKGGVKVKTHNLTYVTKDALRNALQTAGVKNCKLIVSAPTKVSGTGALTGVFKVCKKLDLGMNGKKEDAAVEELYAMSGLEQKYGEGFAQVISAIKDDVVSQGDSLTGDDIESLVKKESSANGIDMAQADVSKVVEYLKKLPSLGYESGAFADTLKKAGAAVGNLTGQQYEDLGGFLYCSGNSISTWFKNFISGRAPFEVLIALVCLAALVVAFLKFCR